MSKNYTHIVDYLPQWPTGPIGNRGQYHHPYIVPAMDMLIGDPNVLRPKQDTKLKAEHLCIPVQYVYRLNDFYHELSSRGDSARQLIATIGSMLEYLNLTGSDVINCPNGMKIEFFDLEMRNDSSTDQAIRLARRLIQQHSIGNAQVAIMTGSDSMSALAAAAKIPVAHINPETYYGRRTVTLPLKAVGFWTTKRTPITKGRTKYERYITAEEWDHLFPKKPLRANEFVELKYDSLGHNPTGYSNIGRFDINAGPDGALIPLQYTKFTSPTYRHIMPMSSMQAMYLEALLAPVDEIPIVIVPALYGIGKTFLPIAVGINGVGYRTSKSDLNFERIFICPRDGKLGEEIGYISGDTTTKVKAKALSIIDNVREVLKLLDVNDYSLAVRNNDATIDNDPLFQSITEDDEIYPNDDNLHLECIDYLTNDNYSNHIRRNHRKQRRQHRKKKFKKSTVSLNTAVDALVNKYFEFQPLITMGGRSITDSLIMYDEFQDVERFQARELVTRIGIGSKMVITGDPTQLSNPHLNRTSNGLAYVANKLAGQPHVAVISSYDSDEIIRHWVLREIAQAFKT